MDSIVYHTCSHHHGIGLMGLAPRSRGSRLCDRLEQPCPHTHTHTTTSLLHPNIPRQAHSSTTASRPARAHARSPPQGRRRARTHGPPRSGERLPKASDAYRGGSWTRALPRYVASCCPCHRPAHLRDRRRPGIATLSCCRRRRRR